MDKHQAKERIKKLLERYSKLSEDEKINIMSNKLKTILLGRCLRH